MGDRIFHVHCCPRWGQWVEHWFISVKELPSSLGSLISDFRETMFKGEKSSSTRSKRSVTASVVLRKGIQTLYQWRVEASHLQTWILDWNTSTCSLKILIKGWGLRYVRLFFSLYNAVDRALWRREALRPAALGPTVCSLLLPWQGDYCQ